MSEGAKIRILVADDHAVVREGLAAVLGQQKGLELVATAADGVEALERYREHRPDVLLLDLQMPRLDGIAVLDALQAEAPESRVVVLTTFDADEAIYRAMTRGARSYLLKTTPVATLVAAIHAVHGGRRFVTPDVAARLAQAMPIEELTARERQVLAGMSRGLSNKEIADELGIAESTVKTFVLNVFGKLQANDRAHAVALGIRSGLLPTSGV